MLNPRQVCSLNNKTTPIDQQDAKNPWFFHESIKNDSIRNSHLYTRTLFHTSTNERKNFSKKLPFSLNKYTNKTNAAISPRKNYV